MRRSGVMGIRGVCQGGSSAVSRVEDPLQQLDRLCEHIRRATQRDMKLLHGFRPTTLFLQSLKLAMLFVEDGLFRLKHQAVCWTHDITSMEDVCDRLHAIKIFSRRAIPPFRLHTGTFEERWPHGAPR